MIDQIFNEDCLEGMKRIPSGSVDMILCDLPYGTTQCAWDSIIPFNWFVEIAAGRRLEINEFVKWAKNTGRGDEAWAYTKFEEHKQPGLWQHYERVIKPNGAIVMTAAQPFTSALIMSNPLLFKYDWTWRKPRGTGHLNSKKQPLRDKEDILVFYKKQPTYNPQLAAGEPYSALKGGRVSRISERGETTYGRFGNGAEFRKDNSGFRYPKQVLEFGVVERGTLHPTQKPIPLFAYLIRTYTNPGEVVLDNCMGSATTAIACLEEGRHFIGFEKDGKYFHMANERIAQWHPKTTT